MDQDEFAGLNEEQSAVVAAIDGPILCVAGAGSGKTTVLARRVAHLIRSGIAPEDVLLLTFTRASAQEMIKRAKTIEPRAIRVTAGTFHSVAARLVRQYHLNLGLPSKTTLLDPSDVRDTLRRLVAARPAGDPEVNLPAAATIAAMISFASNTLAPTAEVVRRRYPEFLHCISFILEVEKAFKEYKIERGLLDYDDLLHAWRALATDPDTGGPLREAFRYVLVDEFQDCNALQIAILYGLGDDPDLDSPAPNIMAVGDPAQSIYAFRGSAPATMFDFARHWPATRTFLLENNYRSSPEILDVANAVDASMRDRFPRTLRAARPPEGRQARIVRVADPHAQAVHIAKAVLARKADGVPLAEQAILTRSLHHARMIEAELATRRIPYRVMGGLRLDEARHVKDLLSFARVMLNPSDEPAWMRILCMVPGIGEKKAARLAREIRANPDPAAVDALLREAGKKHQMALIVANTLAVATDDLPTTVMERLMARAEPLFEHAYDDWGRRRGDIEAITALAAAHRTVDEFMTAITIDLSTDKKSTSGGDEEAPLTLSTIHSAKGLEWTAVYCASFHDGHMPSSRARTGDEYEEELRTFYVAVTRAKRHLELIKPAAAFDGSLVADSPFEAEIRRHCVQATVGEVGAVDRFSRPPAPTRTISFRR